MHPANPIAASARSARHPRALQLLETCLDLVHEQGLAALSIRSIAERTGVTVTPVSYHLGSKTDVLSKMIDLGMEHAVQFHKQWHSRSALISANNHQTRLALVEHALCEWLNPKRRDLRLLLELLISQGGQKDISGKLSRWHRIEQDFWTSMAGGDALTGELLSAFALDEALFSVSLNDVPSYRLLRSICLRRLLEERWDIKDCSNSDLRLFQKLVHDLKPETAHVPDTLLHRFPGKKLSIARSAGHLLAESGFTEMTHRAVSRASGIPISTIAYYCPRQQDLLLAGLYAVIDEFHSWRSAQSSTFESSADAQIKAVLQKTLYLVRCTGMIGLASRKYPELIAAACDMRRRRGENFSAHHLRNIIPSIPEPIDPVIAQAFSICSFGSRIRASSVAEDPLIAMKRLLEFFPSPQGKRNYPKSFR